VNYCRGWNNSGWQGFASSFLRFAYGIVGWL
jgi:hypothetical protein